MSTSAEPSAPTTGVPVRPAWWVRLNWHHPEWTAGVAAALAWVVLVVHHAATGSGHDVPDMPGMPVRAGGPWIAAAALWLVMLVAMMLPTLLPTLRAVSLTSRWNRRHRAACAVAVGYLAVWAVPGLAAVTVLTLLPAGPPSWLAGVVLVAAAGWVATPVRRACLAACHRTVRPPGDGWRADRACAREGVRQGLACVGTCWLIMAAATLAPHDLLPMAALTVTVVVERVFDDRRRRAAGWVTAALAVIGVVTFLT